MTKEFKRTKFTKRERPGPPATHGAYCQHIRERYSDLRTKEGQRLHAVTQGLIADLGGQANINTAQSVIIENIKSKLIVLFQISDYADKQITIVDENTGELLPCLGRNFLSYSEALRRDLEALQKFSTNQLPSDLYDKWRKEFFKDATPPAKDKK